MKFINNFKKVIKNKNFNSFINKLFIYPLLYFIQYDYEKYKILALFASVFILIKDLINIKILGLIDSECCKLDKLPTVLIFKISKMFIGIIFFFLQFKFKFMSKYNVWIANFFYLKYIIQKAIPDDYSNNIILFKMYKKYKKYKKYASNLTNIKTSYL